MNGQALLQAFRSRGFTIRLLDDETLDVSAKPGVLTPEVVKKLRRLKPQLIRAVKEQAADPGWRLVYSRALGELVVVVTDRKYRLPVRLHGYVVYGIDEVRKLEGCDAALLQKVQLTKRIFGGTVVWPARVARPQGRDGRGDGACDPMRAGRGVGGVQSRGPFAVDRGVEACSHLARIRQGGLRLGRGRPSSSPRPWRLERGDSSNQRRRTCHRRRNGRSRNSFA